MVMGRSMTDWYHKLTTAASKLEAGFDQIKFRLKLQAGRLDPVTIQTYRGHGTPNLLYLKGRVLEYQGITSAEDSNGVWENILNMYRRFDSKEIPYARLRVRFQDTVFEAQADNEGYFDLQIKPSAQLPLEQVWHEIDVELLGPKADNQRTVRRPGHVLVPPPQAEFGIISDVDDTIIRTGATDPLTMARIVVLNNPRTRLAFEGVGAFYKALRKGRHGTGYNPIFYVSSSPWNLYDLVIDFLNIHGIPLGPLFLRDVGLEPDRLIKASHFEHKLKQIRTILEAHRALPFILIGDSGQEDPEIYREVVREYPGRIQQIYIRDVTLEERATAVREIIKEIRTSKVEMLLVPDTSTAAEHAVQHGFITADALPDIRADKATDEQDPTLLEQLPGLPSTAPKGS